MLQAGVRLGPYEVLAPLGAGGMGEVYKARDSRLDRVVALKIISPALAASSDLRQRFEREARTISRFSHPNICGLYDIGEAHPPGAAESVRFLVLEYCEGHTLAERIMKGPLPIEQAVRIGIDICSALHRAHAAGIIHRDLKPANVMLTPSGAKLLDFGLARPGVLLSAGLASGSTLPTPLTDKGTLLGTFQYMAPELIEGEEADIRSDIWSLGCVLYEMITGHRAFQGKSQSSVIAAILEREPEPLLVAQPTAPPIIDALIRGCLAKAPADRIQSAHDVGLQLRWIAGSESGASHSAARTAIRPRRRFPWVPVVIGASLATAVLVPTYLLTRPAPVARAVVVSIPPPEASYFTPTDGFAVSPDGGAIAFVSTTEPNVRNLWVRHFDSISSARITTVQNPVGPFWSPDGKSLGIFAGGFLQVINLGSGTARPLIPARPTGAAWGEQGVIAFPDADGLYVVGADGSGRRALTTLDANANETSHSRPVFLPDSDFVLFHAERTPTKTDRTVSEIRAVSLSNGGVRSLGVEGRMVGYDDGQMLFVSPDGALRAQPLDVKTLKLKGSSRPLRQSERPAPMTDTRYAVSPAGAIAYRGGTSQGSSRLTWIDRNGKQVGTVGEVDNYSNPALSHDGQRLAVGVRSPQTDSRDIWIFDLARRTSMRFTHDEADDFSPAWSPDGTRIAFSSDRTGVRDLFVKPASGLAPETILLKSEAAKSVIAWSADGALVFYSVDRGGRADIDALRILDGGTMPVLNGPFSEMSAAPSPDGTMLAYVSDENGVNEVFVRTFPAADAKWQVSAGGGMEPQWRRDQRELYYIAGGSLMAVAMVRGPKGLEPQTPRKLFDQRLGSILRNRYVASPDGQRFLMNVPAADRTTEPITVILNWRQMRQ